MRDKEWEMKIEDNRKALHVVVSAHCAGRSGSSTAIWQQTPHHDLRPCGHFPQRGAGRFPGYSVEMIKNSPGVGFPTPGLRYWLAGFSWRLARSAALGSSRSMARSLLLGFLARLAHSANLDSSYPAGLAPLTWISLVVWLALDLRDSPPSALAPCEWVTLLRRLALLLWVSPYV